MESRSLQNKAVMALAALAVLIATTAPQASATIIDVASITELVNATMSIVLTFVTWLGPLSDILLPLVLKWGIYGVIIGIFGAMGTFLFLMLGAIVAIIYGAVRMAEKKVRM